jgi:hypothetical protein
VFEAGRLAIDVTDLERDNLARAQASAVGDGQCGLVLEIAGAGDQMRDLLRRQHDRQLPRHVHRDHPCRVSGLVLWHHRAAFDKSRSDALSRDYL